MLLQGLKVVELSTWVAAPSCAMLMAEWGADVIKVESAAGDPMRGFFPDSAEDGPNPVFSMENRGKRSVVLDIAAPAGKAALLSLLGGADAFVTNLRPGALRRAGLDYPTLAEACPQLIYVSVSGYGLEGDEADLPAFDLAAFWARSGVAAATIPPDQEPFPSRPGFGDHVTALAALAGLLAAVHERGRTGVGRLVESSLARTGVYALGWDLAVQLRYGQAATAPSRDQRGPASGFFRTADGRWISVSPRGPGCVPALLRALELGDLIDRVDLTQLAADPQASRDLRARVEAGFGRFRLEDIAPRLVAADLIWAPMARLEEVVADPQFVAAGCFAPAQDSWGGTFLAPAGPIRFPGLPTRAYAPAPRLGEHTEEILREAAALAGREAPSPRQGL